MADYQVTVAPNGARRQQRDHPMLPITPQELAQTIIFFKGFMLNQVVPDMGLVSRNYPAEIVFVERAVHDMSFHKSKSGVSASCLSAGVVLL